MNKKFIKVMFETTSGANNNYKYKINEVNTSTNWNPNAKSGKDFGGFNFTTEDSIIRWLHRGDTVYDVIVPQEAECIKIEGATTIYRANKVIIKNPRKITDEMALEFYRKSSIPDKSYYRTLAAVSLMNYKKTALTIFNDKINENNIKEAIEDWKSFFEHKGKSDRKESNETIKLINNKLQNLIKNILN